MNHRLSKVAALASATLLSGISAAAPVAIDSEQKAQFAVLSMNRALFQPWSDHLNLSTYVRSIAENALAQLKSATTPAAVRSARNGVVIACETSGSMSARLSRGFPRVLKVQWQACRFNDISGYPHQRSGDAEILLLSDSFAPNTVGGIRLGNATTDFTDTRHIEYPDQITDELRTVNLRLLGQIPMTRAFPLYGLFVGEFAFETTGFVQDYSATQLPDLPLQEVTSRTSAEFLISSGATTYNDAKTKSVEDLRLHFGKVTRTVIYPPPFGENTDSYSVEGLKVRKESDYASWTGSQSVDGKIDWQFGPTSIGNSRCLNGTWVMKTRAPLVAARLYSDQLVSGDVLINGSTSAQFFSAGNVPPTLPTPQQGMLIHLDVAKVGNFNYDVASLYEFGFQPQCN